MRRAAQPFRPPQISILPQPTFGAVYSHSIAEAVKHPDHEHELSLETWDGRKAKVSNSIRHDDRDFVPGRIGSGIVRAIRFPPPSKPFGSPAKLIASMRDFLLHYAQLTPETAALLVVFALASWFPECIPVAPVLFLLGPEGEARRVLQLLATLCRRPALLSDLDLTAIRSLPEEMNVTLLINQRDLPKNVRKFLLASADRHFHVAQGHNCLHTCGAKAISSRADSTNAAGVRVVLSPTTGQIPVLSDAEQKRVFDEFQPQLLRYRELHWWKVRNSQPDVAPSMAALRDEVCGWLAPLLDSSDLQKPVLEYFSQRGRGVVEDRLTDELCVAAEAALFFCHRENTHAFFVRELADRINQLLQGRHELGDLTDKKAGMLLRELGIPSHRVVKGFKVSLSSAIREQIHAVARAYRAASIMEGVVRCGHCQPHRVR